MITIDTTIPKLEFVNNPIRHRFTLSNGVDNSQNSLLMFEIGEFIPDGAVISFQNNKGVNRTFVFEDVLTEPEYPTDVHILTYGGSGEEHIIPYYKKHILPALHTIPNLYKDYDVKIEVVSGAAIIYITAKEFDEDYDFDINYSGGGLIESDACDERSNPYVRLEAEVIVYYFDRHYEVYFSKIHAGKLFAEVDKNGEAFLDLNEVIASFLESNFSLTKSVTTFKNIINVDVFLKEIDKSNSSILSQKVYSFHCLKGGLRTPFTESDKKAYYEITEDSMPKMLSVVTNDSRIPPNYLVFRAFTSIVDRIGLYGMSHKINKIVNNELTTIVRDTTYDATDKLEPMVYYRNYFDLTDAVSLELLCNDASNDDNDGDEINKQVLIVDHTPYETENFFFFFNSLGWVDLAWFTGDIHYSNKPNVQSFISPNQSIESFAVAPTQKFVVKTGPKTKNEILWMQEIIQSEMIYWLTKEEYIQLFEAYRESFLIDESTIKLRVVKPITQEIVIKPNGDNFEFEFEFEVLNHSKSIVSL